MAAVVVPSSLPLAPPPLPQESGSTPNDHSACAARKRRREILTTHRQEVQQQALGPRPEQSVPSSSVATKKRRVSIEPSCSSPHFTAASAAAATVAAEVSDADEVSSPAPSQVPDPAATTAALSKPQTAVAVRSKGGTAKKPSPAVSKTKKTEATTKKKKPQMKYDPDVPMTKEEATVWRREQRRKRNRESAAASRQRQRDRITELESEVGDWKAMVEDMMAKIDALERETGHISTITTTLTEVKQVVSSSGHQIVSPPLTKSIHPRASSPNITEKHLPLLDSVKVTPHQVNTNFETISTSTGKGTTTTSGHVTDDDNDDHRHKTSTTIVSPVESPQEQQEEKQAQQQQELPQQHQDDVSLPTNMISLQAVKINHAETDTVPGAADVAGIDIVELVSSLQLPCFPVLHDPTNNDETAKGAPHLQLQPVGSSSIRQLYPSFSTTPESESTPDPCLSALPPPLSTAVPKVNKAPLRKKQKPAVVVHQLEPIDSSLFPHPADMMDDGMDAIVSSTSNEIGIGDMVDDDVIVANAEDPTTLDGLCDTVLSSSAVSSSSSGGSDQEETEFGEFILDAVDWL